MAIPNRRQFVCPENITFPTSENFFFLLKSFFVFQVLEIGLQRSYCPPPADLKPPFRKISYGNSSVRFSFPFFCGQKFLLSLDFFVSTFPPRAQQGWLLSVGWTEFLLLSPTRCSSKSSFVSRNGSCHSSRVFFFFLEKRGVCICVQKEKRSWGKPVRYKFSL